MGGGDLNLKKSWHPTTLKNMERVWKAEQKHEAECKKIEELQKELEQERAREEIRHYAEEKGVVKKKADRLDWMYEGPSSLVNREEYLLGRNVDKTFELMSQEESGATGGDFQTDADTIPESILRAPAPKTGVTIDLANKIREDPLLVIKQQEEQSRKDLLHNPVRLKQLQLMLQQMSGKKRSKKDKKKKKKGKRRSGSSSEDEDNVRRKERSRSRRNDESVTRRSRDGDRRRSPLNTERSRMRGYRSPSPRRTERRFDRHSQHEDSRTSRRDSRSPPRKTRDRGTSQNDRTAPKRQHLDDKTHKRLDAAEKERRLQEMITNAQWRDEQRNSNMNRHLNELKAEEELKEKTAGVDIVTPLLHQAARIGSVESRIKSNIYNIQRTKAALEKSFTKR